MRLSELKPGEYGIVKEIHGSGVLHRRLLSMGLLPGSVIRMVRAAPFGDPVEYEIRGFFISLRKNEASYVEIDKIVPLYLIPDNTEVRVVFIDGGVGFIKNMSAMGISPGKSIKVIKRCCPMQVLTDAGMQNIGRGMAFRVFVR